MYTQPLKRTHSQFIALSQNRLIALLFINIDTLYSKPLFEIYNIIIIEYTIIYLPSLYTYENVPFCRIHNIEKLLCISQKVNRLQLLMTRWFGGSMSIAYS